MARTTDEKELVELRNYRLVPDGLDDFVEHFERRFLASQEALGMDVVGQFRVLDEADRFVWIRRFLDPPGRGTALHAFYTGPVWAQHGGGANELMVDHTDVHLLVPDASAPSFARDHRPHATRADDGATTGSASTVVAALYELDEAGRLPTALTAAMDAAQQDHGPVDPQGPPTELGRLVTATTPNDFPRLPVHEATPVGVWLLSDHGAGDAATAAAHRAATRCGLAVRTIRLAPTARSTLR